MSATQTFVLRHESEITVKFLFEKKEGILADTGNVRTCCRNGLLLFTKFVDSAGCVWFPDEPYHRDILRTLWNRLLENGEWRVDNEDYLV